MLPSVQGYDKRKTDKYFYWYDPSTQEYDSIITNWMSIEYLPLDVFQ